jgi:hypothetical protein
MGILGIEVIHGFQIVQFFLTHAKTGTFGHLPELFPSDCLICDRGHDLFLLKICPGVFHPHVV